MKYNHNQQRTAAFVNKEDHCDGSPESRHGDQNYLKGENLIMKNLDSLMDVVKGVKFFRDSNDLDRFFAEFKNDKGAIQFASLDSEKFKSFLFAKSCDNAKDGEILEPNSAVKSLRWLLTYHQAYEPIDVFVRTAGNLKDEVVEYDLQRGDGKTVHITAAGWNLLKSKRKFVASSINLPQVKPKRTEKTPLELLKPFVNLKGNAFRLYVIWLIQSFTRGNHHALLIFAERGSSKSTLSKLTQVVISPCEFSVTTLPDAKDDIRVLLKNTLLCCFDNVSKISNDVSDLFCGAITGTSTVKRSLYTDGEPNVSHLHNILVINGIGVVPEREDLAERMLILKLKKLQKDQIKQEAEIWSAFREKLPEILGSIFNTLSAAMSVVGTIDTKNLPRMADSYVEMAAIALALGIPQDEFRAIYDANKAELEQARVGTPLVTAVKECMETVVGRRLHGSASEVYQNILGTYSGDKKLLPQSASRFTRKLEDEYGNLAKAGFRVNIDDTGAKSTEITIIKKKV